MNLIASKQHKSSYPNPISFTRGETVQLGKPDTEYPGWIWITTQNGNQGWAAEQYLAIHDNGDEATTTEPYSAYELDTQVGDQLKLFQELNQWVLVQNSEGVTGWVPLDTTTPM
jgi:SH3-like domain-containing protein